MGTKPIIDKSDPGIVITEIPMSISDAKLNGLLNETYEAALKDCHKFAPYDLWSVCWSIVGSLFLTISTATFHDTWVLSAKTIETAIYILFGITTIAAFIFTIWRAKVKSVADLDARDKAVKEIIDSIKE